MKRKTFLKRLVLIACAFSVLVIPSALAAKKGVPFEGVYGRIQFVDSFADYDVKIVEHHEDLRVRLVERFPDSCGKWQIVARFRFPQGNLRNLCARVRAFPFCE